MARVGMGVLGTRCGLCLIVAKAGQTSKLLST